MGIVMKLCGGGLVCLSCALVGLYFAYRDNYRIIDLTEFRKALLLLKSEIGFARNTLPEAFGHVGERADGAPGRFFTTCAERLCKNKEPFSIIWRDGLRTVTAGSYLVNEDIGALARLADVIGYLDAPLQIEGVEMAVIYIDGKVGELAAKNEKNRRMYRSLGILGGLLATVLIL